MVLSRLNRGVVLCINHRRNDQAAWATNPIPQTKSASQFLCGFCQGKVETKTVNALGT